MLVSRELEQAMQGNILGTRTLSLFYATDFADQLENAGLTWMAYQESIPKPCFAGSYSGTYSKKHSPFLYYKDLTKDSARCRQHVVGFVDAACWMVHFAVHAAELHGELVAGRDVGRALLFDLGLFLLHQGHIGRQSDVAHGHGDLQQALARYGYGIAATGKYDTSTMEVVTAFQRHFRPARVDGTQQGSGQLHRGPLEKIAGRSMGLQPLAERAGVLRHLQQRLRPVETEHGAGTRLGIWRLRIRMCGRGACRFWRWAIDSGGEDRSRSAIGIARVGVDEIWETALPLL